MSESTKGHKPASDDENGPASGQPNVDEVREWLERVGDARPSVEPDLHAIVDRAGQRVFRRRIGTGLALLGLIVPGAMVAPGFTASLTERPTATTVVAEVDSAVLRDGGQGALVSISECLSEVGRNRARFGTCRYM